MTVEEYVECRKYRVSYNLVIDTTRFHNLNKIHPIKQSMVSEVCKICSESPYVCKVIVFGSSITDRCKFSSDIDLCIEWSVKPFDSDGVYNILLKDTLEKIQKCCDYNIDIVAWNELESEYSTIKDDILKGVVIYE